MMYRGNIEDFRPFWSYFITCVRWRKDKSLKPDDGGEINLRAFLIFGTLSNCPGNVVANEDWVMADVMDQHDADKPDDQQTKAEVELPLMANMGTSKPTMNGVQR